MDRGSLAEDHIVIKEDYLISNNKYGHQKTKLIRKNRKQIKSR